MTLFSRCEASQDFGPGLRSSLPRRSRVPSGPGKRRQALSGFVEDIGILFLYAAGLDYYGRDRIGTER